MMKWYGIKEMNEEAEGASMVPILIFILNKIALTFTLSSRSYEMMPSFEISLFVMNDSMKHFKQESTGTAQAWETHVLTCLLVSAE